MNNFEKTVSKLLPVANSLFKSLNRSNFGSTTTTTLPPQSLKDAIAGLIIISNDSEDSDDIDPSVLLILNIFNLLMIIIALYLAFKCAPKSGKIDILQALLAILFAPVYIAYRLAIPC